MFLFAGLIIFRSSVSKLIEKPVAVKIIIFVLITMLAYGFIISPATTWQSLKQIVQTMLIFIAIFTLFVSLIDFHIAKTGTKEIKTENIKPNMNLEEQLLNEIEKDKEYNKQVGKIYPDGLTKEQVPIIKKWLQENKRGETIKIYKPFPFVVWMFIGVIITLILKSSLFHLFINTG